MSYKEHCKSTRGMDREAPHPPEPRSLRLPLTEEERRALKAGEMVLLSGIMYTARDQAHLRMVKALEEGEDVPIPLEEAALYYCGPTPARPGRVTGAIGPTTSSRMDPMTPPLLARGLKLMIGKGARSPEVIEAMVEQGALYLSAIGGAGALYADCITAMEAVAYEDLLSEAVYRIKVRDFPAVVAVDTRGNILAE